MTDELKIDESSNSWNVYLFLLVEEQKMHFREVLSSEVQKKKAICSCKYSS